VVVHRRLGDAVAVAVVVPVLHAQLAVHVLSLLSVERTAGLASYVRPQPMMAESN
jgi:hypothetical protein